MTGTIEINRLRIHAYHGVMRQEREVGNIFEITVHIRIPMDKAFNEDNLAGTINYAELIVLIKDEMRTPVSLIEHMAWRLRDAMMHRYPAISGGMVKVAKITPPVTAELQDVAVKIEW